MQHISLCFGSSASTDSTYNDILQFLFGDTSLLPPSQTLWVQRNLLQFQIHELLAHGSLAFTQLQRLFLAIARGLIRTKGICVYKTEFFLRDGAGSVTVEGLKLTHSSSDHMGSENETIKVRN